MDGKEGEVQSHARFVETGKQSVFQVMSVKALMKHYYLWTNPDDIDKILALRASDLLSVSLTHVDAGRLRACLAMLLRPKHRRSCLGRSKPETRKLNFLLQERVDVNRTDGEGNTPLFNASKLGFASMVKRLLDAGANVKFAAGGFTPLHVSAEKKYMLIMDYLHEAGVDVNALSPKGNAALYFAISYGNLDMVRKLLSKGAQTRLAVPSIICPLHAATARGHADIVEALIDAGAKYDARNFDTTPVLVAISYQQKRVLECLLARGAVANPSLGEELATHFTARKGSRNIVTLILDAGVEIDTTSAKVHTALQISAAIGNEDLVDRLLTRSASVNFKSLSSFAALHDASLAGHIIVIKQFLYAGADEAGVDVNAQSSKNWTPLFRACQEKDLAVVEFFLKHGAKPNLADCQGHTPLSLASSLGELSILSAAFPLTSTVSQSTAFLPFT